MRASLDRAAGAVDRLLFSWRPRSVAIAVFVLMLCWSLWIVAFCPGSMIYDTFYQITQFYPPGDEVRTPVWTVPGSVVDARFSDHHPLLDTLVYGWFGYTSQQLTGSWNAGIFLFSILQALGCAVAYAVSFSCFRRVGASRSLVIALFACVCLVPVFGACAPVVIKDMLFSAVYIAWFTMAAVVVFTRGEALRSAPFLAGSIVLALLLALTKKTGVYVVVPTMLAYAVVYRRAWWRCLAPAFVSAIVVWGVMPGLVFPALDVVPGGRQEALGTLFQQTARCVVVHGDEMGANEREAIDDVLCMDTLGDRYVPGWADPVKYGYDESATREELGRYLEVWAAQGLRYPGVYVEATLAMLTGFVSPSQDVQYRGETWDAEHGGNGLLYQPQSLAGVRDVARGVWDAWADAPVLGLALTCPPYVVWIPLFALWVCACRLRRWLPIMVPVLLSMAIVLMSPMYDARYACALVYTAPLLLCALSAGFAHDSQDSAGTTGAGDDFEN